MREDSRMRTISKPELAEKLVERKETFIESKDLDEYEEEVLQDFITWILFRMRYGDYLI